MAASCHYGEKVANTKTFKAGLGNVTLTEHGEYPQLCAHIELYTLGLSTMSTKEDTQKHSRYN